MANFAVAPPGQPDTRTIDTTTALLNNATYTSNGYRVGGWDEVSVLGLSDQAGTLNIDQSVDGTNWDYTSQQAVAANVPFAAQITLYAAFVRVRFNTAGSQSTFRMSTMVKAY